MFKSFYKNTALFDITLVCNDNKTIKAHKLALASASTVMKDLITNNPLPGNVLKINVSSQNMKLILKYVYTGECEFEENNITVLKTSLEYLQIGFVHSITNEKNSIIKKRNSNSLAGYAFQSFYKDVTLSDLTLVTNDNKLIRAHKQIISSASKVLSDLIINNTRPDYVLRINASSKDMELVLRFVYTGECHIKEEYFAEFKNNIDYLQIKYLPTNGYIFHAQNTETQLEENKTQNISSHQNLYLAIKNRSIIEKQSILSKNYNVKEKEYKVNKPEPDTIQKCNKEKEEKPEVNYIQKQEYVGKPKENYVQHDRKCPDCGKLYRDITHLKKHMNAWKGLGCVESRLRKENPLLSCTICDFKIQKSSRRASNKALQAHKNRFHREKNIVCEYDGCNYKSIVKNIMEDHKQRVHITDQIFTCEFCGVNNHSRRYLKEHMRMVHGEKIYKCKICQKQFRTHGGCNYHMASAHLGIKYTCEICGYVAQRKDVLAQHMHGEHEGQTFDCNFQGCESKFKRKCYLNRHKLQHKHQ